VISTGKLKIYTINGSKYCAKNECNTMIPAPRTHKHSSSGEYRPSDIGVTVNINAEFNLMAVNTRFESFSRDPVTEYCHGLESTAVYTAPSFLSKPSLIAQIGVYRACRCIIMHKQ